MIVYKLPKDTRESLVQEIRAYFENEMSHEIGDLAAGNVLDFMMKQLGPIIYNQAIGDARAVVVQQMDRVEEEIFALEQPIRRDKH